MVHFWRGKKNRPWKLKVHPRITYLIPSTLNVHMMNWGWDEGCGGEEREGSRDESHMKPAATFCQCS